MAITNVYESTLVDENAATVLNVGPVAVFTTIQAAINAASAAGPTLISVQPGTYPELLNISGKANLVIRSATAGTKYTIQPPTIGEFGNAVNIDGAQAFATNNIVFRDAIIDGTNSGLSSSGVGVVGNAWDVDVVNCEAFGWGLSGFKSTWGSDNLQTSGCDGVWFVECEAYDNGATSEFGGGGFSHFAMRDITGSRRSMVFWRCLSYDNLDLADVGVSNWDGNGFIFDVSGNWTGDMVMVRCMSWNNMGRHLDVTRISGGTLHMYMNTSFEDGFPASNPAGPVMAQAVDSTGVTANIYGNVWHHTHPNGNCFIAVTGGFGAVNSGMNVRYDSSGAGTRNWGAINTAGSDIVVDPLLANLSTDNMRPGVTSPAHANQSPAIPTATTWTGFVDPNSIGLDATPALATPTWGAHADGVNAATPSAVDDSINATVGTAVNFDYTLNDTLGDAPNSYSFVSGAIPPGMGINTGAAPDVTNRVTGTPTTAGTYTFTYRLTDGDGETSDADITVVVAAAQVGSPVAVNDDLGTVPCDVALSFSVATNDALGDGTAGQHAWTFISGAIPPGLTLSTAGLLAGTPTTPGSYQFTYALEDVDGDQDTATVTVVVAEKTTGDGPTLVDDFNTAAQVGVAYSFDVTTNDDLGATPTIVSYDSGNVPPGLTFAAGILSGTPTIAGTYQFVYSATDANGQADTATTTIVVAAADGPAPGECCEIALTFLTVEADGPATSCCDPRPLIVDANGGTAYANGFDAAGNPAVVVPGLGVAKDAVTYNSAADQVPPAECCLTNEDINRPAYDSAQNCVTHICMGPSLGWRAICGNDDGGTVEPPPDAEVERVCYSTTGILPGEYGGTGTGWLVSGLQQLDIACEGTVTGSPTSIGWTVDFDGDAAGGFYPLPVAQLAYPLTDTGQTAEVNGGILPGNGVSGGMFGVEFGASSGEGPIAFSFTRPQTAQNGPAVNAWVFNTATGTIEQIASSTGGGSIQNNPSFPGDHLNTTATGTYGFTLVNQSADPADLILYFSAVNDSPLNEQGQPLFNNDVITDIEVTYVAEGDCCNTLNTAADIAALFTANDPIGNTWTIIGSTVCSDMPIGQGASYGVLQLCDVGPVTPTIGFP